MGGNKHSRELHALDTHELELRLVEAQNELVGTRFNLATRKTENTARLREAKKQLARLKTILAEREQEG